MFMCVYEFVYLCVYTLICVCVYQFLKDAHVNFFVSAFVCVYECLSIFAWV